MGGPVRGARPRWDPDTDTYVDLVDPASGATPKSTPSPKPKAVPPSPPPDARGRRDDDLGEVRETPIAQQMGDYIARIAGFPNYDDPMKGFRTVLAVGQLLAPVAAAGGWGIRALDEMAKAGALTRMSAGAQNAATGAEQSAGRLSPFFGGTGKFDPLAERAGGFPGLANESPSQAWLRTEHNQRLARQNIAGLRYNMPPVEMQGPNAPMGTPGYKTPGLGMSSYPAPAERFALPHPVEAWDEMINSLRGPHGPYQPPRGGMNVR